MDGVPVAEIAHAVDDAAPCIEAVIERVTAWETELEEAVKDPGRLRGKPTGSAGLDAAVSGWRPGLWVWTGDTSSGKTSLCTWLAFKQAELGEPVGVMSFE